MIILSFGGNASNSREILIEAMATVSQWLTSPVSSTIHITKPLGPATNDFYNAVMVADDCALSPSHLHQKCLGLEMVYGRARSSEQVWGNRSLDIDLIAFHRYVSVSVQLVLPHPQMHRRRFVLDPLCEIAPAWRHPLLMKTALELSRDVSEEEACDDLCQGSSSPHPSL